MKLRGIKRIMVAAVLTVVTAIAGVAGKVHAFSFTDGDLVLAIYGNETEALYNLGTANTVLAPGSQPTSLDVSAGLQAASVGINPVRYAVYGHDSLDANNLAIWAGTRVDPAQINAGLLGITIQFGFSLNQAGQGGFTGDTVAKADPQSFSSNLDPSGDSNFSGTWPVAMFGEPGDNLHIVKGDVLTSVFTQVGQATLAPGGLFTIGLGVNPVPLPAGVVLFGTGVIGLIGIVRRSFSRTVA
jgi:hypothetical protein